MPTPDQMKNQLLNQGMLGSGGSERAEKQPGRIQQAINYIGVMHDKLDNIHTNLLVFHDELQGPLQSDPETPSIPEQEPSQLLSILEGNLSSLERLQNRIGDLVNSLIEKV